MSISIEISPGELLDRMTILAIKLKRLSDPAKRSSVAAELARLESVRAASLEMDDSVERLFRELETINDEIWTLTDEVYLRKARGGDDPRLIAACLEAFALNADRSKVKHKIDLRFGAANREIKNYGDPIRA
jgi:hypothetical protein